MFDGQPSTKRPCNECPWRRGSAPGWLGPLEPEEWIALAHSDEPIACHATIREDEAWLPDTLQCAGAANYRRNVGKMPRDPDIARGEKDERVFATPRELLEHHGGLS